MPFAWLPSPLLRTTKEKGASAKTKGKKKTGGCGGHTYILYRLRHKISLSKGYRNAPWRPVWMEQCRPSIMHRALPSLVRQGPVRARLLPSFCLPPT